MGDGGTIPNLGQKSLNLSDDGRNVQSVFQIAVVTGPLMSVGRICDEIHKTTFDAQWSTTPRAVRLAGSTGLQAGSTLLK